MPKLSQIVCLGGGNAMPKALLSGLKRRSVKISVICAMLDSGGSTGRLRKDYHIVAPGDIKRALITLAQTSPAMESLFNYRFETGELAGHSFANLFIAALELTTNDFGKVVSLLKKILNIDHQVLPVTLRKAQVCAILETGEVIRGETNIDIPKHDPNLKIKKVFLQPRARAYPPAAKAIKKADLIVIGPGDLYSTLAQILLVKGIKEAFFQARAKKAYVCNLMQKLGETNGFSVPDFANQIEEWLEGSLDFVLYNNFFPEKERLENYKREHPELLEMVKINDHLNPQKFLGHNLLFSQGPIEHDPEKLTRILLSLL